MRRNDKRKEINKLKNKSFVNFSASPIHNFYHNSLKLPFFIFYFSSLIIMLQLLYVPCSSPALLLFLLLYLFSIFTLSSPFLLFILFSNFSQARSKQRSISGTAHCR